MARLRMAIAATLALIFAVAVLRNAAADQPVLVRQWLFADATMGSYFLLGAGPDLAIRRGAYRPWMA